MDEMLTNALRWVLLTDETGWRGELDRALRHVAMQAGGLEEVASFLAARYDAADPSYQPRMKQMIEHVRLSSASMRDHGDVVPGLATEYIRVDKEIVELEEKLAAAKRARAELEQRLLAQIGAGEGRDVLGFRFEHAPATEQLVVLDPTVLPMELTRPVADEPAITQWVRLYGRTPRGVERREVPPRLTVVQMA
jgi:hypothetical protein